MYIQRRKCSRARPKYNSYQDSDSEECVHENSDDSDSGEEREELSSNKSSSESINNCENDYDDKSEDEPIDNRENDCDDKSEDEPIDNCENNCDDKSEDNSYDESKNDSSDESEDTNTKACNKMQSNIIIQKEKEIQRLKVKNGKLERNHQKKITDLDYITKIRTAKLKSKIKEIENKHKQELNKSKCFYEAKIAELKHSNESFKSKIEILEEEHKKARGEENIQDSSNYQKLYVNLLESLKEQFDSPIGLEKMKSPFILKSGQTIDEFEIKRLYEMKSNDPYDRTKIVDIMIPNLALRNIMDTVQNIEDRRKKNLKYLIREGSANEKGHKMNLKDGLDKHTNLSLTNLKKSQLLSKNNCSLIKKKSSLNSMSQKLNKELESITASVKDKQLLIEKMRLKHKQIVQDVKELQSGNESIRLALNMMEQFFEKEDD